MAASSETAPQRKRARHFRLAALMVSFSCLTAAITILLQLLLVDHYAIEHASDQARLRLQQLSWQMRDSLDRTLDQEVRDVYQLFLDMDGFKQINDTRGHEEGDQLLRQFGTRIVHGIREADLAARLAGDEFVVILDMLNDELDAAEKADVLLSELSRPYGLSSGSVQIGASIGVALQMPYERQDPARLLARAEQAMYEAKRKGKNRVAMAPVETDPAGMR
jgi:diguanylate cyclase (GGDEF)-like protein